MEKELVKAVEYQMNFKDYNEKNYYHRDWTGAVWDLFNAKNTWSNSIYLLDIGQRGKDENNFYQNFIRLIVPIDSRIDWDEYLEKLGYVFSKEEITLQKIYIDWNEKIDEYVLEVD